MRVELPLVYSAEYLSRSTGMWKRFIQTEAVHVEVMEAENPERAATGYSWHGTYGDILFCEGRLWQPLSTERYRRHDSIVESRRMLKAATEDRLLSASDYRRHVSRWLENAPRTLGGGSYSAMRSSNREAQLRRLEEAVRNIRFYDGSYLEPFPEEMVLLASKYDWEADCAAYTRVYPMSGIDKIQALGIYQISDLDGMARDLRAEYGCGLIDLGDPIFEAIDRPELFEVPDFARKNFDLSIVNLEKCAAKAAGRSKKFRAEFFERLSARLSSWTPGQEIEPDLIEEASIVAQALMKRPYKNSFDQYETEIAGKRMMSAIERYLSSDINPGFGCS